METLMTFISSGQQHSAPYSQKQQQQQQQQQQSVADLANDILNDDVLNEFLDPQFYHESQSEIIDYLDNPKDDLNIDNAEQIKQEFSDPLQALEQAISNDELSSEILYDTSMKSNDFKRYETSKDELMKLKFGGLKTANQNDPAIGFDYLNAPTITMCDDADVSTTPLPIEYQEACNVDENLLPYKLNILDLPSFSRVETQIKFRLNVSPPPPEFLLHLPRDTIAKPKMTLEANELPASIKPHMLYLDTFVVGASSEEGKVKSCNVCKRCMRRELKRASRRKAGLVDDSSNWDINLPKRAIIFNCKEVVSFPRPTGSSNPEKSLELLSRIVCYCRHHQEPNGFKLLFVLKDGKGNIIGKTYSNAIMIMDRKKALKGENLNNEQQQALSTKRPSKGSFSDKVTQSVPKKYSSNGNSPFSYDESSSDFNSTTTTTTTNTTQITSKQNLLGDENSRHLKRQKRPWSPPDASIGSYFDSVNQQRGLGFRSESSVQIKKEAISPMSSDAVSPHNRFGISSATSVFSTTPEKKVYNGNVTLTPPYQSDSQIQDYSESHSTKSLQQNVSVFSQDLPMIQRIIPAHGPIRGGTEITLLGSNFHAGLAVKFGSNQSLATHCWSESTIVTYLPPATQAGPVLVTFEDPNNESALSNTSSRQIFTYTDDTDRQLIELALQIVGLKMNGKLEDAKNIAKRIIGNNQLDQSQSSDSQLNDQHQQQQQQQQQINDWMTEASNKIKQLSKSTLDHEQILLKFLSMLKLPNSPFSSPNWAVCNGEGQTMLHLACIKGYGKLCKYLIKHGSKVDFRDINDFTPLHFALMNGYRDIIRLLIRFKANLSLKLNNGIYLKDISDSNVLDLIDNADTVQTGSMMRRLSSDSIDSEEEDNHKYHPCNKTSRQKLAKNSEYDASEFEADDEDNFDEITEELNLNTICDASRACEDKPILKMEKEGRAKTNPFGLNLWMAMKEAIISKMNESGMVNNNNNRNKSAEETDTIVVNPETTDDNHQEIQEDVLPSYDDLFPNGASLRTLMNFRGHMDDMNTKKLFRKRRYAPQVRQISTGSSTTDEVDIKDDERIVMSLKSQKTWDADKRLLFFWLPFMLLLLLIVVGNYLNLVSVQNFTMFSNLLEGFRDVVGSFMLGKDRFTSLLNDNLNYGRERMENLLNDVNDAVMTAVVGVAR